MIEVLGGIVGTLAAVCIGAIQEKKAAMTTAKKAPQTLPHADDSLCVFELIAIRIGANRASSISFHTSKAECDVAEKAAVEDGFATRTQRISMPATPRDLARLLTDYATRFNLRV